MRKLKKGQRSEAPRQDNGFQSQSGGKQSRKELLRVTELQRKLAKSVKIPPAQANAFVNGWTSTTSNIENWDKIPGAARISYSWQLLKNLKSQLQRGKR